MKNAVLVHSVKTVLTHVAARVKSMSETDSLADAILAR